MVPVQRPAGTRWSSSTPRAAPRPAGRRGQADAYYFAPQKSFAADGGLWLALLSPAAIERVGELAATDRWIPESLSLATALDNSRKDQTYNTPAVATLSCSPTRSTGCSASAGSTAASSARGPTRPPLRLGARQRLATPFVADPAKRSLVVGRSTSPTRSTPPRWPTLRANGIVDTEPYRKLGRNQLRIGLFPAIDLADVQALTACIDWVVDRGS
jgi:phosphoserine aminotransferase